MAPADAVPRTNLVSVKGVLATGQLVPMETRDQLALLQQKHDTHENDFL